MASTKLILRNFRILGLNDKIIKKGFSSTTVNILNDAWVSIQTKGQYSGPAKQVNSLLSKVNEKSTLHTDAIITAMAVNSCARNPAAVRHLLKALPLCNVSLLKQKRALELLLHAYCVADNILCTETLLHDWFKVLYSGAEKVSVAATNIINDLNSRHQVQNSESDNELKVRIETIFCEMKLSSEESVEIPLRTWSSITRFYSHRKAWVQCLKILDFLEEEYPPSTTTRDVSASDPDLAHQSAQPLQRGKLSVNGRLLWHLLDAQCLLGTHHNQF